MDAKPQEVLVGSQLEAWLDEIDTVTEQFADENSGQPLSESSVPAMLAQYAYQPDNLDLVWRLFNAWAAVGNLQEANRVLVEEGARVVASLPDDEQASARLYLVFWKADLAERQGADELTETLMGIEQFLLDSPYRSNEEIWRNLANRAASAQLFDLERRCVQQMFEIKQADAERTAYRAWDAALLQTQLANSFQREGEREQAVQCARAAIQCLQDAADGQDIDDSDWLRIGGQIIEIVPDEFDVIATHIRRYQPDEQPQALKRDLTIRLARLQARGLYASGQWDAAFACAGQGRYMLRGEDNDNFTDTLLVWMAEQQRYDEAAALAFESMFCDRQPSATQASQLALWVLANKAHADARWPILLAYACRQEDLSATVCQGREPEVAYAEYFRMAEDLEPNHPAWDLLNASQFFASKQYDKALPLLEKIQYEPRLREVFTGEQAEHLLFCRAAVHGIDKMLQLPEWKSHSGSWYYNLANALDNELEELFPEDAEKPDWPEDKIERLVTFYYERGIQCFEQFFSSGDGHFRDGDVHTYSMMCNNLGIKYGHLKRYEEEIAIHRKGIAISPFAEHYDCIMGTYREMEQWENYVAAAEDLWNFAVRHGYYRHQPQYYMWKVANVLSGELDRGEECAIWLERLQAWWQELDDERRPGVEAEYWSTRANILRNVGYYQLDDAVAMMDAGLEATIATQYPSAVRMAAYFYEEHDLYQQAYELYQLTLQLIEEQGDDDDEEKARAEEGLEDCRHQLGIQTFVNNRRPWWKLW